MANIKRANTSGITKTGTAISDVPDAPTIGTATAGAGSATVTYTAAATGGTVVTFTATSSPGSLTGTGASPITVSGLTNGTAYTFTITGTNTTATGAASAASNSVTPVAPSGIAGYRSGGADRLDINSYLTSIEKLVYSGETRTTLGATLSGAPGRSSADFANSNVAGYQLGGFNGSTGSSTSVINKLLFSNDSNSSIGATLSVIRGEVYGVANTGTAGYAGGGYSTGGSVNSVDKLTFSNDTRSTLASTLSQNARNDNGAANGTTEGYFYGASADGAANKVFKLVFSTDTLSDNSTSTTQLATGSASNYGISAYLFSGSGTNIYVHNFSGNTISSIAATITGSADSDFACSSNKGIAAYTYGSINPISTLIRKIVYATNVFSTITPTLAVAVACSSSYSNDGA